MTYKEIRDKYQYRNVFGSVAVDFYATLFSPFLTKIFIKLKKIPNEITVYMIISGLIGGGLFLVPNIIVKLIGLFFIHLWYVLDCSDGEVARITKRFSKFGKELDFTAHILNHPLYNLAFASSLISLNRYNNRLIIFTFMLLCSLDLVSRNLLSFNVIYDLKMPSEQNSNGNPDQGLFKKAAIAVANLFDCYPNFALIFPIMFFIDYFTGTNISIFYLYLNTTILFVIIVRLSIKWVNKIIYS